jgi:type I restriction enzyme S subunit
MSDEQYELPAGWTWARLSDVVSVGSSQVLPKRTPEQRFNYLALEHIEAGTGRIINFNPTLGRDIGSNKFTFKAGDVLYGKLRPYLRKATVAEFDGVSATDLIPLRSLGFVEPPYLQRYLLSPQALEYVYSLMAGIKMPRLRSGDLHAMPIPVAPLPEQRRIVAKLEALFEQSRTARQALDRIPPLLKKFRQSVLAAAFRGDLTRDWREQHSDVEPASALLERTRAARRRKWEEDRRARSKDPRKVKFEEPKPLDMSDLPSLPDGWTYTTVREVSRTIQYGYTQSGTSEPIGPKFLRITDIQNGRVDWEKVPHCEISEGEKAKYVLGEGDIVFARSGATTGKSYLIRERPPSIFASYLIRVQPFPQVLPEYLYAFFQTATYWDQITTRGNAQPNANAQVLGSVTFPLAPISEQQQIVSRIEDLLARADNIEAAVEATQHRADTLEQSILARAFLGKLVPQDPNDEPASAFIQRILNERKGVVS